MCQPCNDDGSTRLSAADASLQWHFASTDIYDNILTSSNRRNESPITIGVLDVGNLDHELRWRLEKRYLQIGKKDFWGINIPLGV